MDELHRRKVTAYTHPNEPACCRNLATGVPSIIIEYGTDTTRTIASLIFSGTAARCSNINFIFSHGGGTLTALTERFTVQVVAFPQYKDRGFTGEGVMKLLQGFYYDTAQCSNPIAMASLTKFISTSNIVFGTDYPYRTAEEHVKGLGVRPADLAKIERNACALCQGCRPRSVRGRSWPGGKSSARTFDGPPSRPQPASVSVKLHEADRRFNRLSFDFNSN
jgi:predicted TIM-barrel fold metal-dependent hydrolase